MTTIGQYLFDVGSTPFFAPEADVFSYIPTPNRPVPSMPLAQDNVSCNTFHSGVESHDQTSQVRNGQLTPPSAKKTLHQPSNKSPQDSYYQFNSPPQQTITPRASWSDQTRQPEPIRQLSPPSTMDSEEQRQKRQKFLARNRVAASKCRQRKKAQTKELQSLCDEVCHEKKILEGETKNLRNEVSSLKDELLKHSQCGDQPINLHLAHMVTQTRNKDLGIPESPKLSVAAAASSSPSREIEPSLQMSAEMQNASGLSVPSEISEDSFEDLINIP